MSPEHERLLKAASDPRRRYKESQASARYTDNGTDAEHCGNCQRFSPPRDCKVVVGPVIPRGWCRRWQKKAGSDE